jgi:PKD repeat protein
VSFGGSSFSVTVPSQSITLLVVSSAGGPVNQPPTASFTATPTSGQAPLAVAFNGASSSDPDGTISSYAWVFGDGATGSGVSPSHTYSTAGTYTARLTVTDNQGATGTTTTSITVSAAPTAPTAPANLSASAGTGRVVTLQWTDTSTNETAFSIERAAKAKTLAFAVVGSVGANVSTWQQTVSAGQWVFRVRASNAVGNSPYSNTATVRVR